MNIRRNPSFGRPLARWLLPLWGLGAGCFIDLPERVTDGGLEAPEPDALSGTAPGMEPEGPGSKPPATVDPSEPDATPPGVAPPPPPIQPPSGGPPPPTMAPTAAPSGPSGPCEPGICHACDGDQIVPAENDVRCEVPDCRAFPLVLLEQDPVTGVEVCRGYASRVPSLCDPSGQCRVASAESCITPDGSPFEYLRGSACRHIRNCRVNTVAWTEFVAAGQPCIGEPGTCDGVGRCNGDEGDDGGGGSGAPVCESLALMATIAGAPQTFCEASHGATTVCRFALQLGSTEADPAPLDFNPQLNCGHFCRRYGWSCVAALENDDVNQCELREPSAEQSLIENGCDRTLEFDRNDDVDALNGVLCDCRLP